MLHPLGVFGRCSSAAHCVLRKVAGIDLAGNCVHEQLTRTRFGIGDDGAPLDARIDSRLTGFDGASSIWIVGSSECSTIRSSDRKSTCLNSSHECATRMPSSDRKNK